MASVFCSVWPALSARCDDAWIAGPSAIGSVNGMPSSITSAPAFGSAEDRERGLGVGIARGEEGHQRGAAFALQLGEAAIDARGHDVRRSRYSATLARSLSPRPDRLTTIR